MPRLMWKSFHLCFPSNLTKLSSSPSDDPSRPSIHLVNNFNLLYDDSSAEERRLSKPLNDDVVPSSTSTTANSSTSSASYADSDHYGFAPDDGSPPPDLTAVLASRRFFFSSPGRSNSITDSPDLCCRETATTKTRLLSGGTAVKQYVQSPDPYNDFRRSMQEMLDAVTNAGDLRRYEFLHELLLSYISLNSPDTHKFMPTFSSLSYRTITGSLDGAYVFLFKEKMT